MRTVPFKTSPGVAQGASWSIHRHSCNKRLRTLWVCARFAYAPLTRFQEPYSGRFTLRWPKDADSRLFRVDQGPKRCLAGTVSEVTLSNGDTCAMEGRFQKHFVHQEFAQACAQEVFNLFSGADQVANSTASDCVHVSFRSGAPYKMRYLI